MGALRFITAPDGSLQFLKRGMPPEEMPGYEPDPGDPYMFHPILAPCAARIYKNFVDSECCPIARHVRHCTKYGYYQMTPETCKSCSDQNLHQPVTISVDKLNSDT